MIKSFLKGWIGEKSTQLGMWVGLDDSIYFRSHNIIIPTNNGTTQIDHVIISKFGVFVIETKNYAGWIFGDKNQNRWTQVLFNVKNQFQNPLHQNYKHTKSLAAALGVGHEKFHSIVYFVGDSIFKTQMPANVLNGRLSSYIKTFDKIIFSQDQLNFLCNKIQSFKDNPISTKKEHRVDLKERLNDKLNCPKCNSKLVLRIAKQGKNIGQEFFGCSNYPKCRYTKMST